MVISLTVGKVLYNMDQGLSLDDLGEVVEELHDVSPQWYKIGLQLKLSPDTMDKIKGEETDSNDQLLEMLKIWLKRVDPKPTWEALVKALRTRSVGRAKEANRLEEKYCKGRAVSKTPSASLSIDAPTRANKQQLKDKAGPVIPKHQPQMANTETVLTTSVPLQKSTEDAKKTTKRASTSTNYTETESKMPIQKRPKVQQSERFVGGYRFLEPPPENLICTRCKSISTDPKQLKCCGKLLCQSCLKSYPRNACPNCRKWPIDSFPDKKSSEDIQNLEVECSNAEKGCSWKGKLKEFEYHRHLTCLKEEIVCPYSEAGCEVQCLREEMDGHQTQSQKHHLDCTLETIRTLKDELYSKIASLTATVEKSHNPPLILVIPNVISRTEIWHSPPFYTSARGYKMRLEIFPSCSVHYLSLSLKVGVMTGDNDDYLKWPCKGTLYVQIPNPQEKNYSIGSIQIRFSLEMCKQSVTSPAVVSYNVQLPTNDIIIRNFKQYLVQDSNLYVQISKVELSDYNRPWILTPQPVM